MRARRLRPYAIHRNPTVSDERYRYAARTISGASLRFDSPVYGATREAVRQAMERHHPEYIEQLPLFMEGNPMSGNGSIESGGEQR